jgi:uroporphyrinogen decarboxylase
MPGIKPIRQPWKGEMTARERFVNQMRHKPVDRCFNMEFGYWNENFTVWPLFYENGITNNDEADIFFNFDKFVVHYGKTWMSPPFEEKAVEVKGNTKVIMNADGLLAEVPLDGHDTIPHYLRATVVTPDDWKKCKDERFARGICARRVDVDWVRAAYPAGRDFPAGVDCGSMIGKIRDMLTFEGLAYAVYDYPEMVDDMVETCCLLVEDFLDQILPVSEFDFASGWEDICFKNGPIVSPPFFRDTVMPRYKRIKKKLAEYGIDIWFTDCDGDVRKLLPYFLEGGINCLFPFEVNGCAHPGELLDQYGKELRIMGGFDKMKMIEGRQAIDEYMDSLVPYVKRGGFIPFCDHRCPPDVKPEDYLYYLDRKEAVFGMK